MSEGPKQAGHCNRGDVELTGSSWTIHNGSQSYSDDLIGQNDDLKMTHGLCLNGARGPSKTKARLLPIRAPGQHIVLARLGFS